MENPLIPSARWENSIYDYKGSVFMEYEIVHVSGNHPWELCDELKKQVQRLCKDGWKPQGGVTIGANQYGTCTACQAMIKLEENEKEHCIVSFTEL